MIRALIEKGDQMESLQNPGHTVLQTRLYRPQLPGSLLTRSRLLDMLDFNPPKIITLVTAPAGFGKTTLVSSRLDKMLCPDDNINPDCLPSAWLAIDESDKNFTFFMRHFTAALRKTFPESVPETNKLVNRASEINVESISLILNNEIMALSQRFVMVLDDFYRSDCPQLLDLLSRWTRHWPLPMHMVIISRTQPPLPLAGLKSQGKLNDIRSKDMRFSPQEAEDYIKLTATRDISKNTLTELLDHIEGWIAGLKLTAIALNNTNLDQDVESLLDLGKQDMINYLADEVFNQMTTAKQILLMKISILEAFCPSLCLALVDKKDLNDEVTSFLENLSQSNLFVEALHEKDDWFKMHHLLRSMLQSRLSKSYSVKEIKELHLRIANWYYERSILEKALEHALKADEKNLIVKILDQSIFAAFDKEDHLLMDHLLKQVTEEMIASNPQLLLYKSWLILYKWDTAGIKDIIGRVEKMIRNEKSDSKDEHNSLFGQLAFFKGYLAYRSGNCREAVKFFSKALPTFPSEWNYARGITVFYLGVSIQFCESTQRAADFLQQSYKGLGNRFDSFALNHLFALSYIYLHQGDLKVSEQYSQLLLDKARKSKSLRKEGYALLQLGMISYQRNRLDLAEQWFQEAYKVCSFITSVQTKIGYFGLALALNARRKFKEAIAINQELAEIEFEQTGQISDLTQVNRLQILISQNRWREAEQWADSYTKPFTDKLLMPSIEDPLIFKAKVLIARNDPKDLPTIMEFLNQYMEIASKSNNNRCKAEALALSALAESNAGKATATWDLLIESLEIAARGNMIRLYLDLGAQMEELLKQVTPVGEVAEFVQDLLSAFAESNAKYLATNQSTRSIPASCKEKIEFPFFEKLTLREKEVLGLMAEAISLQDIADRLFISYATAKRHTVNIYSKLGVHNRWEAVSFARENGII